MQAALAAIAKQRLKGKIGLGVESTKDSRAVAEDGTVGRKLRSPAVCIFHGMQSSVCSLILKRHPLGLNGGWRKSMLTRDCGCDI